MESTKSKQNTLIPNTITLQNSQFSCSESQKQKFISLFNNTSSHDSEYYQYSSLEVPNFPDDKSNDNQSNSGNESKKLSSIPENVSEEESSSIMEKKETGSKIYLIDLMKSSQQNLKTNKKSRNGVISPIFCSINKNGHIETNFTVKKIELSNKKNNINESNELEIDNNIIKATNNQCICTSSLCLIY